MQAISHEGKEPEGGCIELWIGKSFGVEVNGGLNQLRRCGPVQERENT
jgi:hypothetical protein